MTPSPALVCITVRSQPRQAGEGISLSDSEPVRCFAQSGLYPAGNGSAIPAFRCFTERECEMAKSGTFSGRPALTAQGCSISESNSSGEGFGQFGEKGRAFPLSPARPELSNASGEVFGWAHKSIPSPNNRGRVCPSLSVASARVCEIRCTISSLCAAFRRRSGKGKGRLQ